MQSLLILNSMYLARQTVHNNTRFIIRESLGEEGCLHHRDLLDLGENPRQYIVYAGSNTFYIDAWVTEQLIKKGVDPDPFELERLFFPFLDPRIRSRINSFADRAKYRNWKPLSGERKKRILLETHMFDRRRLHFLRFGQTDQRRLDKTTSLYDVLLDKSRDEIEQYILQQEQKLRPDEYKQYLYTVFDLQRFFTESFAVSMPEALDIEKMDQHFVEQICRLDADARFWKGMRRRDDRLAEYLVRYVIMYFDYSFSAGSGWEEYIRSFMDSRRRFIPPARAKRMSMTEISTVFGVSRAELAAMSRRELKRLFRKKARELHPDQGGDHDMFIELADAYNELMRTKK
ncbi:MAG: J domain-containing protein [Desulfobulbaceae bacterium]|nr:J domain-containing protein [Desulfobulbaceae bacterium]